jgi:MHS family proline/betaine transporter-like MFS transporter
MMTVPQSSRALVAACVGNLLEWYDFTVYALFAAYIAESFFPSNDPSAALVKTFLTFGALAPWLLLLGRLLQGFSAGGEIGTASALLAESAAAGSRGGMAAWQEASMGLSNILGALVAQRSPICFPRPSAPAALRSCTTRPSSSSAAWHCRS